MGRSIQGMKEHCQRVKILYERGMSVAEIAEKVGASCQSVHNALNVLGINARTKRGIDESNFVYADNSVKLENVVINGKRYIDITSIFSPR